MKNSFLLLLILILTANAGYCETAARSALVHDIIIKFTIAMMGVAISSFVIYLGLSIYNKIISKNPKQNDEEILTTPKTKEEAIKFFIRKNKL